LLLSFIFLSGHFANKREFMYVLILIAFFEIFYSNFHFKLRVKQLAYIVFGFIFILWAVVTSSILRGYGNYGIESPTEAAKLVPDYLASDFAQNALVHNFELNTVYGNGSNA